MAKTLNVEIMVEDDEGQALSKRWTEMTPINGARWFHLYA
jgi:hypothetical protein